MISHQTPVIHRDISANENVIRVIECIRNESKFSEKVFARPVYVAIRDGREYIALDTIRKVVPKAALQIMVEAMDILWKDDRLDSVEGWCRPHPFER